MAASVVIKGDVIASDVFQGVTTEVFGEAFSLGPGGPQFAEVMASWGVEDSVTVDFPRLSDGLEHLDRRRLRRAA